MLLRVDSSDTSCEKNYIDKVVGSLKIKGSNWIIVANKTDKKSTDTKINDSNLIVVDHVLS